MPSSTAIKLALAFGSAIAAMAMRILDGVIFLGLPPVLPLALAATRPAIVRSTIRLAFARFRICEELQAPLEQAATELRRPKAWIINEALAAYFEHDNRDQRMYRETLEGLADVEAGRVIEGDQVVVWIESWGSDNELPPPRT